MLSPQPTKHECLQRGFQAFAENSPDDARAAFREAVDAFDDTRSDPALYVRLAAYFPECLALLMDAGYPVDEELTGGDHHARMFLTRPDITEQLLAMHSTPESFLHELCGGYLYGSFGDNGDNASAEVLMRYAPHALRREAGLRLYQEGNRRDDADERLTGLALAVDRWCVRAGRSDKEFWMEQILRLADTTEHDDNAPVSEACRARVRALISGTDTPAARPAGPRRR